MREVRVMALSVGPLADLIVMLIVYVPLSSLQLVGTYKKCNFDLGLFMETLV